MGLRDCVYTGILYIGTVVCLTFTPSDEEFLLKCSYKTQTSTTRQSDWIATYVNGSHTYCEAVSSSIMEKDWSDTYLVIVCTVAGAMAGVSLTLFVIKIKLMRHKSKSLQRRKNATELRTASRKSLHLYESLGSLAIDSRYRVYQNQNSLEGSRPMDTYINVAQSSRGHHRLYSNTDGEERSELHAVNCAVSKTLEGSEKDLSTLRADFIIDQLDLNQLAHKHSLKLYASDQLSWDDENNGYIIPITPTNSQLSLSPPVTMGDIVIEIPPPRTNEQIVS